jgi:tetratricopeptide (TPR) repeat protein
MSRAHAIGQALGDHRLDTSWSTGYFYASTGEVLRGIEECRGGLARAQDPLNTAAAQGFLGYAYLEKGDIAQAREALQASVQLLQQTGFQPLLGWFSAFLAEADLAAGSPEEARELALQALRITEEAKFRYGMGLAQRALGRIALSLKDLPEAEVRLQEALATFAALEVPFEVARTQLDLAELAHARGSASAAARELGEAHRGFTELGFSHYQEKASRLSAALAVAPSLASVLPAGG